MSKLFIEDTTLTAIGDAIREKTGSSELIAPLDMPTAIGSISGGGGGDLPEEAFTITGNCYYRFAYNGWNWFINNYGDRISTSEITRIENMFCESRNLTKIPFEINLATTASSASTAFNNTFYGCDNLIELPLIKGNLIAPTGNYNNNPGFQKFFSSCRNLREIPYDYFRDLGGEEFWNAAKNYSVARSYIFENCNSLRELPDISLLMNNTTSNFQHLYYGAFSSCYCLNEIINLPVNENTSLTSDAFTNAFKECYRLKNMTFATQEDGTPYTANWKNQIIVLNSSVGYGTYKSQAFITRYNSGITADKEVYDDATYQALKDDPDWFTYDVAYSRYNHDSAVATINSLPDTSAYIAANGGTNTIKFKGESGSATDGGAINLLTEDEIAVATAKGWTVQIV